ncbi:MAG TPA: helix-turn-helix domain-containing protein [Sphingobium sp.]|uniref:helix-turn-helix domain-containing protein n=1 Tax=Sphingobium sp. TaxID=1912891 RepID=UPI002ED06D67
MSPPADRNAIRNADGNVAIIDAARAVIASRGLSGMSLRTVAENAGISVGSISYRIGDRAALVEAIVDREIEIMEGVRQTWRDRLGSVDPMGAGLLPDLICEWLDDGARERRTSAVVTCELALQASRDPQALPRIGELLDAGAGLWRDLLPAAPDGERLALLIACYCLDEQPFSILLSDNLDYRLLRHSTVRALLRKDDEPVSPDIGQWHMALVDRLAEPAAAAFDRAGDMPLGAKAVLAEHIADVIITQGVGALSHRVIAQASGMAVSSIAHHYPGHRDILFAGVEALYRRMRADLRTANAPAPGNGDIIRLTHESALTALNNPGFMPFAIDMRRRRAENVHVQVAQWLGIPVDSDRARVQAVVMAFIGEGLRTLATDEPQKSATDLIEAFTKDSTNVF